MVESQKLMQNLLVCKNITFNEKLYKEICLNMVCIKNVSKQDLCKVNKIV